MLPLITTNGMLLKLNKWVLWKTNIWIIMKTASAKLRILNLHKLTYSLHSELSGRISWWQIHRSFLQLVAENLFPSDQTIRRNSLIYQSESQCQYAHHYRHCWNKWTSQLRNHNASGKRMKLDLLYATKHNVEVMNCPFIEDYRGSCCLPNIPSLIH